MYGVLAGACRIPFLGYALCPVELYQGGVDIFVRPVHAESLTLHRIGLFDYAEAGVGLDFCTFEVLASGRA